jgi:hypothetical protein
MNRKPRVRFPLPQCDLVLAGNFRFSRLQLGGALRFSQAIETSVFSLQFSKVANRSPIVAQFKLQSDTEGLEQVAWHLNSSNSNLAICSIQS